jgi:hypothetical protein
MIAGFLLSLMLVTAPEAGARLGRLPPVDQCSTDASFAAFRDALLQAIARRDREHLLSILADDILVDFGGGAGRAAFVEAWQLDRPETSPVWDELGEVLRLGCVQDPEHGYWAPSMFMSGEIDDPFGTALAIRPGAPLHAAPDAGSARLASLDWDLVSVIEWNGEDPWQRVRTADGREGYVRSADLRSPVDYRAGFRRIDGSWRMSTFIAGD